MKNNHWIWMVIGCGLPLLFIFFAPSLGIGSSSSLFIFILFMFACHLFMPHGSHRQGGHNHSQNRQREHDEHGKDVSKTEPKDEHKGHHHH